MNPKRIKIDLLKQKVNDMKQSINQMSTETLQSSPLITKPSAHQPPKDTILSNINKSTQINIRTTRKEEGHSISTHQSQRIRSSTSRERFIKNNRSLQTSSPVLKELINSIAKSQCKNNIQSSYQNVATKPTFKKLIKRIDQKYYESVLEIPSERQNKENSSPMDIMRGFSKSSCFKIKVEKVKTYEMNRNNPILNPEPEKNSRRKIVKQVEPSPCGMLTDHPQFNQKLQCLGDKTVIVQKKGAVSTSKNKSSIIFEEPSAVKLTVPKKTNKKHFSSYSLDLSSKLY